MCWNTCKLTCDKLNIEALKLSTSISLLLLSYFPTTERAACGGEDSSCCFVFVKLKQFSFRKDAGGNNITTYRCVCVSQFEVQIKAGLRS